MNTPEIEGTDHGENKPVAENTHEHDFDVDIQQWLKEDTPPEVIKRVLRIQKMVAYSGPLPPSFELGNYEEVLPGAADRIITMAEKAQELQEKAIVGGTNLHRQRISSATIVSLGIITIGGLAIVLDPAWLSLPLSGIGILTLSLRQLFKWMRRLST